jgi:hypothetical protein
VKEQDHEARTEESPHGYRPVAKVCAVRN